MKRFWENRLLIVYLLFWAVLMTAHYLLLRFLSVFNNVEEAIAESLVFNIVYAVAGIGIWFMVRFSDIRQRSVRELFFLHLSGVTGVVFLWLAISMAILKGIFSGDSHYHDYLNTSISIRIVVGVFYYVIIASFAYLIINVKALKAQKIREYELRESLKDAELNLLRSQVKPHFLFNSLHSISSLTMSDSAKAQDMIIKLSEYIRYSFDSDGKTMSTLAKECYHIAQYIDIERVRYGKRLSLSKDIEKSTDDYPVPAMMLQPLIENAIKHGIYESLKNVSIHFKVRKVEDMLMVTISNTFETAATKVKGTGKGLQNIRLRLQYIYGRNDLMRITKNNGYFMVELKFPAYGNEDKSTDR